MTTRQIIDLYKKYKKSDHNSFDLYEPNKHLRKSLETKLLGLGLNYSEYTTANGNIKGFTIESK